MLAEGLNNFDRVRLWNSIRGNNGFNRRLEAKMIVEEIFEFLGYEAKDCKELSEVFVQTYYKKEYDSVISLVDTCDALGDIIFIASGGLGKVTKKGQEIFNVICDANDLKSKERDKDGKIIKNENFANPNGLIFQILKDENGELNGRV